MAEAFLTSVHGRAGHFQLESGHHAEYWMELETLFLNPSKIQPFAAELASKLVRYNMDVVCGPFNEGAFVALMVATELHCEFSYAERLANPQEDSLYPIEYKVPKALHRVVRGKRVAIINDVISAGSAVRGTFTDLHALGANVVAVGAFLTLGDEFRSFALSNNLPLQTLAERPFSIWIPSECPLCRVHTPLEVVG